MIKQLLRAWLRPKSIGEGYITIIYPQRGRGVVIHDTLTKGATYSGSGVSVRPTHLPNSSIKDDGVRVFLRFFADSGGRAS